VVKTNRGALGTIDRTHGRTRIAYRSRYDCEMNVFFLDSISAVSAETRGHIVVSGSHGGVSAARLALAHPPALVIFNDAGIGLDEAGIAGLHVLQAEGVAACAVSHMSARIGSAQSTFDNGLVTSINEHARSANVQVGMTAQQAIDTFQLYR
jgi:hypothetical protein